MKLTRGLLIAVEGIDGAGKTTQAQALAERLRAVGFTVRQTKEPTNGEWGQLIRSSKTAGRLAPEEELAAFLEDRKQHVREVLSPAMKRGDVVIVDRYYYSTAAYQGVRGAAPSDIIAINEEFAPRPDLLVILDVPAEVGIARIRERGDVADHFERLDDLALSASVFRALDGPHVLRLDGTRPAADLTQAIADRLYDGPLFRALCRKSGLSECEPAYCSFYSACDYIRIGALSPVVMAPTGSLSRPLPPPIVGEHDAGGAE